MSELPALGDHHFLIGHRPAAYVAVDVLRRARGDEHDEWDANWIVAWVSVAAGAWHGRIEGTLRAGDFRAFREALESVHETGSGEARFNTVDEWLTLVLRGDGLGGFAVHGEARDAPGIGNLLTFELDPIDDHELAALIEQLKTIETSYPVRGRRR